jgi:hypothetical protein
VIRILLDDSPQALQERLASPLQGHREVRRQWTLNTIGEDFIAT